MVDGRHPLAVWSGIPGEEARVRVVQQGQNQDLALFVEAETPSEYRVEPVCERYTLCGGCPFMHMNPAGQERAHRALVRAPLDQEGLGGLKLGAYHASPDGHEDFRHVIKLGFGYSDQGRMRVGAWGRRDRAIVPIPRCNVAHPVLRSVMVALAHHTIELDIRPYDAASDQGILRAAVLRVSRATGEVLVTLVVGRRIRQLQDLAEAVAGQVSAVTGVWVHINDEPGNSIYARDEAGAVPVLPLVGKATIEERLGDVTYDIGPGDFFQTNPAVAEVLYKRVVDQLDLPSGAPVVDLYSGVGGVALQAAARGAWALGIEGIEGAVNRARSAARRQSLQAEFLNARVEDVLPELPRRLGGKRPIVVVDPARRGLEPGVIDGILALDPVQVAYVSCNPRALSRDLARFVAAGLAPGDIELFDMFPNTAHVETLVVLKGQPSTSRGPGRGLRRKVVR